MNAIPQKAIEEAIRQSKLLGHSLTGFERESPHSATAECVDCKLSVRIEVNSAPDWFRIDNLDYKCADLIKARRR